MREKIQVIKENKKMAQSLNFWLAASNAVNTITNIPKKIKAIPENIGNLSTKGKVKLSITTVVLLALAIALPILAKYGYLQNGFHAIQNSAVPYLSKHVFSPIASLLTSKVPGWAIAVGTGGSLVVGGLTIYGASKWKNRPKTNDEEKPKYANTFPDKTKKITI
jgi:hypothetical protein